MVFLRLLSPSDRLESRFGFSQEISKKLLYRLVCHVDC
uniref:Uncharacterized protein n=1 Tax=Arundo donax TaxID=35708 RepID=A0A0A9DXE1_ARUDO